MAAPTLTSLSVSSGPAIGGTPVTLTGTNFTSDATVIFGPTTANDIVVVSSTSITCLTPPQVGLVAVTVTEANGSASLVDSYTGTPMPVALYSSNPGTTANYVKYIFDTPVKSDRDGDSILLDFTLADVDADFVQLRRGNYITFTSQTYPLWFTGYITNEPEYVFLGEQNHVPHWGYKYQASSDDYILSMNPLGILPPFINMTQGQIIKSLVQTVCPVVFDTSNVQDGLLLARYVVDPTQKFSDVIKVFAQTAVYRFYGQGMRLYYTPKTDIPQGLTVDSFGQRFTPANLKVKASTSIPLINDCLVMGEIEPQRYTREYFIGDGMTGEFPLSASVFGVESVIILDDSFSNSSFDTSKWTVYDEPTNFLQISNGFLNCIGGTDDGSYAVHLDSVSLLQLASSMRFAHGEFDFIPQNADNAVMGVICGLWTQEPNYAYTGCVYGIQVQKIYGQVYLNPIVNGVVDTTQTQVVNTNGQAGNPAPWNASLSYATGNTVTYEGEFYTCIATTAPDITPLNSAYWAVSTAKRYVIRTLVSTPTFFPGGMTYNHLDKNGVIRNIGGFNPLNLAQITYHTYITEIDPNTGLITDGYPVVWTSTFPNTIDTLYCLYIPMASDNLHATVTGITISTPMQCTLGLQEMNIVTAPSAAGFINKLVGPNEIDATDGLAPYATISQSGGKNTKSNILGSPAYNLGSPSLQFFKNSSTLTTTVPQEGDIIRLDYRSAGAAIGRARDQASVNLEQINWQDSGVRSVVHNGDLNPIPQTSADCTAAAAAIIGQNSFTHYEGTYEVPSQNVTAEPRAGAILTFTDLTSDFPVSTFSEPISLVSTAFSGWNHTLEVFTHTITYGLQNDSVRLLSVLSGFQKQSSVFTVTDTTEVPAFIPVTGVGLAFAPDVTSPSMDPTNGGTYVVWQSVHYYALSSIVLDSNGNLQQVITAGTSGPFEPTWADAHNNAVPIGSVIQSSFVSVTDNVVTITSPIDVTGMLNVGAIMACTGFTNATFLNGNSLTVKTINGTTFTADFTNADYPSTSDVGIGTVTASGGLPLTTPDGNNTLVWELLGHSYGVDATHFYYDMGAEPPTGGSYEVRYTDSNWGCDNGGNLVGRFTSQKFNLPRTTQNSVIFIKAQDGRNRITSSEIWVMGDGTNRYPTGTGLWWTSISSALGNPTLVQGIDSQDKLKTLNQKVFKNDLPFQNYTNLIHTGYEDITGTGDDYFTFTVDLKGSAGDWITLRGYTNGIDPSAHYASYKFTGQWQRLSLSVPLVSGLNTWEVILTYPIPGSYGVPAGYVPPTDLIVLGSRASLEHADAETIYCKTVDSGTANVTCIPYGANSQYASSVVCRYPNIPNPPTGFVDLTDPTNPIVNLVLPSVADDVWGVEIRSSDNKTVLFQENLTESGYAPVYTVANNSSLNLQFYLYTYNLLGEYSSGYSLAVTIATPFIVSGSLQIIASSQTLEWVGENATSYLVQIDHTGSGFLDNDSIDSFTITAESMILSDADFYGQNWFGVTPMNAVGSGAQVVISAQYTPPAPVGFSGINEKTTWTIYGYSAQNPGYPATNAIDGDAGTVWWNGRSGIVPPSPSDPLNQYLEIEFGLPQTLDSVILYNRNGGANRGQPNVFELYTSNDGSSWTLQGTYSGFYDFNPHTYTFTGGSVTANYLKINIISIFPISEWNNGAVIGDISTQNSGGTPTASGTVDAVSPPTSTGDIVVPADVSASFSSQYIDYVKNTYGAQSV